MVTLVRLDLPAYHCTTGFVELEHVVNQQRVLPEEYLDAEKSMVTQAFYNYTLPLLGDPLPTYATLKQVKAPSLHACAWQETMSHRM